MSYLGSKGSGGGSVPSFASAEVPSGAIDGINETYTLAHNPNPSTSLQLFLNGALQTEGEDFSLATNTITFNVPPLAGSVLVAYYMY